MPMTIAKAIEILTDLDKRGHFATGDDVTPALKLGIKALKVIKQTHENYGMSFGALLPGETEEG